MQMYIGAFLIALAVSFFLTPKIISLAIKAGAMDAPDERKVHSKPIPRMGGIAIYIAFMVAVIATTPLSSEIIGLLAGGTLIMLVGIVDDLKGLPAKVKLLGQIIAAAV